MRKLTHLLHARTRTHRVSRRRQAAPDRTWNMHILRARVFIHFSFRACVRSNADRSHVFNYRLLEYSLLFLHGGVSESAFYGNKCFWVINLDDFIERFFMNSRRKNNELG